MPKEVSVDKMINGKEETPCNIAASLHNTRQMEKGEIHSLALRVKKEKKETLYFSNNYISSRGNK